MVNTTVNVTVLDENDNSPRFSADVYNFTVQEELEGAVIGMVTVSHMEFDRNYPLYHYKYVFQGTFALRLHDTTYPT